MADNSGGSWWIAVIASAPSAAGGLWVVWKALLDRKDKQHSDELTREQMLMRDLDAQRVAASTEAAVIFERVKLELARRDVEAERRDARIDTLEKEVDHMTAIARGWQTRAFTLKHALGNARQEVNGMRSKSGQDEKTWPDGESLPTSLEAPEK